MKIRSKLVSVVLVAVMLAFTAYQGLLGMDTDRQHANEIQENAEADKDMNLPASDNKETIYFWYTDEALTDYLGSCAYQFMQEHENARVVPTLVSSVKYLEQINEASTKSDVCPDLFVVTNDSLEKAYLSGLAIPIEEENSCVSEQNFSKTALSAVTYHGQKVAYPFYFETSLFLYNKSYLESMALAKAQAEADEAEGEAAQAQVDALVAAGDETALSSEDTQLGEEELEGSSILDQNEEEISESLIPTTFNEILTLADEYDAPQEVETILRWDVSDVFYNYFFAGNYMDLGGNDGDDSSIVDLNNEKTVECLNVYQGLNQFFSIDAKETNYDQVLQAFMEGKSIFTVATTDAIRTLEEAKEEGSFAWEYGIAPIPNVTKELLSKGLSVTDVVAVNGFGVHKDLASEFATYLVTQSDGQLYERAGKPATYLKTENENEKLSLVMQAYEQSASLPKLMRASNFWVQLEAAYTDIWNGQDTRQVLDGLQEQMQKQIQE